MSWIDIVTKEQAEGRLQELYERVAGAGRKVDNVLQVHSLRPHTLEAHMALYKSVLHPLVETTPRAREGRKIGFRTRLSRARQSLTQS